MKEEIEFDIQEELKKLPAKPGVYLMHNKMGEIIYIGKAVKLKNRVRQYFQSSKNKTSKIKEMISNIVREAKVGDIYTATVVRIEKFGAFVNLFGNTDGLLHISKISHHRGEKVEDVLKIGDTIDVKVTEIDNKGRINVTKVDSWKTEGPRSKGNLHIPCGIPVEII